MTGSETGSNGKTQGRGESGLPALSGSYRTVEPDPLEIRDQNTEPEPPLARNRHLTVACQAPVAAGLDCRHLDAELGLTSVTSPSVAMPPASLTATSSVIRTVPAFSNCSVTATATGHASPAGAWPARRLTARPGDQEPLAFSSTAGAGLMHVIGAVAPGRECSVQRSSPFSHSCTTGKYSVSPGRSGSLQQQAERVVQIVRQRTAAPDDLVDDFTDGLAVQAGLRPIELSGL